MTIATITLLALVVAAYAHVLCFFHRPVRRGAVDVRLAGEAGTAVADPASRLRQPADCLVVVYGGERLP